MANYSLTRWTSSVEDSMDDALAALETKLETVDAAKVIRLTGVSAVGPGKYFQAYAVYDT